MINIKYIKNVKIKENGHADMLAWDGVLSFLDEMLNKK
jgi:hypothetical protein